MIRESLRAFLATIFLLVLLPGHSRADLCGINPAIADIKAGTNYCDTIQAGYDTLTGGEALLLRNGDFFAAQVFDRPLSFTLSGGYNNSFASVTGASTIHGSVTIDSGTVDFDNVVIAPAPPPTPGNNGIISAFGVTPSGVSLNFVTGGSKMPGSDLSYRFYYSDSHTLTTVSDMETYGTPFGDFGPAVVGRTVGKINNALLFSGVDYVDAGNGVSLNFGAGSFSVEAWINSSAWSTDIAGIIGKGASAPSDPGYTLRQATVGTNKYLQFVLGNGLLQAATASSGYVENVWYHVVGVADRTNNILKLYVNGALAASAPITGFSGSTDSSLNLAIGNQYHPLVGQNRFFKGIIDEVAIYNHALSTVEIADRYNAGAGKSVEATSGLAAGWRFDESSGTTAADISGTGNTGALHFSSTTDITGLAGLSSYSMNILVTDEYGNESAYTPVSVNTPILPIAFGGDIIGQTGFHPIVADLHNNGFIEALGTNNDGLGNLVPSSIAGMGLSGLFAPGRIQRTCAIADFNGDGLPDIVCNVFSMHDPYTGTDPVCQMMSQSTPYSPNSVAMLFFNNGDGTFTESPQFTNLKLRGVHGETIVVADFNNDGCLDIFWPQATACSPAEQNYLLINDCHGNFAEVADQAGVAMRGTDIDYRGEGAQAVDFNLDGWIDLYVGSHLYINNGLQGGKLTFTDMSKAYGLQDAFIKANGVPLAFDEGIKFTDWNNDGHLDLIIHHPYTGPALYQFDGTKFSFVNVIPSYSFSESYGLNVFDMNNDGLEDIIVSGGTNVSGVPNPTVVYLNNGSGFERSNPTAMDAWLQDTISFGDIDNDGRLDILKRDIGVGGFGLAYFKNMTAVHANSFFKIDVRGPAGERNQQGRIVKIYPQNHPGVIFTRFVDSGSGYLVQSPYEIFVGTPYQEPHLVKVYYYGGIVEFTINPGEKKMVFPDGTTVNY